MGGLWDLCWKMLAPRWCFFKYLDRCCGILVRRWRAGAPRRGKIGELRRRGLLLGGRDPRDGTQRSPLHPPKNGFSRMGLQKGSPERISRLRLQLELDLEIWKTGRLEDWKTGGLDTGPCVDIVHATVPAARWRIYTCISIYVYQNPIKILSHSYQNRSKSYQEASRIRSLGSLG